MLFDRRATRSSLAFGLVLGVVVGTGTAPPAAAQVLQSELVVAGINSPTSITQAPGQPDRLYVSEQYSGLVRIVQQGAILPTPFMGIFHLISNDAGERGLLGVAFHPDYEANGRVFVSFTAKDSGDLVLARYERSTTNPDTVKPASYTELLRIPEPHHAHNGGTLAFGPNDGLLYFSVGDGGFGFDPLHNGQNLANPLGKILRLDVDSAEPYAVPASNPFVSQSGADPLIFAYGLRNPWRFSFDRLTGDLWIGDVGQQLREEIDFIPATSPGGENFAWRCFEGDACTGLDFCSCHPANFTAPVHVYDHTEGCCVIGGFVYRGCAIPDLAGAYLFADLCGRFWSFRLVNGAVTNLVDHSSELTPAGVPFSGLISCLGEGLDGTLYFGAYGSGEIYRVAGAVAAPDCDGNGIADACDIAAGTVADVNLDGVPDTCAPVLTASDFVANQTASLTVSGAQPLEPVYYLVGFNGVGVGPCFFAGAVCLDLVAPFSILGALPAGPAGEAGLDLFVPASAIGVSAALEVVMVRGTGGSDSVDSNAVVVTVLP